MTERDLYDIGIPFEELRRDAANHLKEREIKDKKFRWRISEETANILETVENATQAAIASAGARRFR